uniref:Uncharacterized protein n=1 Tax=Acrobeloides nanus TaxID=290746 RepID=A0A914E266_9BILA
MAEYGRIPNAESYPIFMHDDSPLHEDLKDFLNKEFSSHCWIGPGSKHAEFPKLSPDLNPLDFFLWGYIKHKVYEKPIENDDVTELGNRIHYAFTEIMPEMLEAAVEAYKTRLKMVVDAHGGLVDVHDDDEDGNKKIPFCSKAIPMVLI